MPVLEVQGLTKRFGGAEVLRDVSFTVERGEIHGLLGSNGSGKTTTLACTLGLLRPTRGKTRVLDVPSRKIHATCGRVGVVFDGANLLGGLSVLDNLEYARRLLGHAGGRSAREAMELVGLQGFERRRAGRLSLGQMKRVAVARALMGRPELLVLDEPLAALDTLGVDSMLRLMRQLGEEGVTILLSSHRLTEMEQVITHATVLRDGRVVGGGSLGELLGTDQATLELRVTGVDVAERILSERAAVVERRTVPDGEGACFVVRLGTESAGVGALNRALVEAGCEVSAIIPERRSLTAVFNGLITPDNGLGGEA